MSPATVSDPSPPDSNSGRSFAVDIIANCIDLSRNNETGQKIIYKHTLRLYWRKDSMLSVWIYKFYNWQKKISYSKNSPNNFQVNVFFCYFPSHKTKFEK